MTSLPVQTATFPCRPDSGHTGRQIHPSGMWLGGRIG